MVDQLTASREALAKALGVSTGGAPASITDEIAAASEKLQKAILGHPGNQGSAPNPMPDAYQDNSNYVFGTPSDNGAGAPQLESQEQVDAASARNIAAARAQSSPGNAPVAKSSTPPDDDKDPDDDDDDDDMEKAGMPPWLKDKDKKGDDAKDNKAADKKDDAKKSLSGIKSALSASDVYAGIKKSGGQDFMDAIDASPALEALTDASTQGLVYVSTQVSELTGMVKSLSKTIAGLSKANETLAAKVEALGGTVEAISNAEDVVLKSHAALHDLMKAQPVRSPAPGVSMTNQARTPGAAGAAPQGLLKSHVSEGLMKAVNAGLIDTERHRVYAGKIATTNLDDLWSMMGDDVHKAILEHAGLSK
jgi:hypothetical protein